MFWCGVDVIECLTSMWRNEEANLKSNSFQVKFTFQINACCVFSLHSFSLCWTSSLSCWTVWADEKPDSVAKKESPISGVKHKDMKTQINPDRRLSFSASPSLGPASLHQNDVPASKDEVRDVQVDKGITTAGQPKKQEVIMVKDLIHIQNMPSPWNADHYSKVTSKYV